MSLLWGLIVVLCTSSSIGTSPLTNYADFVEKEFRVGDGEAFMGPYDYDSQVFASLNPGCNFQNCSFNNGVAVSLFNLTVVNEPAQPTEYHWLWSIIGHPTIQGAITSPGDQLGIDWNSIFGFGPLDKSIKFEDFPMYSSAIMFYNLIEFNDVNNTGRLTNTTEDVIIYSLLSFNWSRNVLENTTSRVAVQFIGQNYTSKTGQEIFGKINLTIAGYAEDGFGVWLPHLCHNHHTNQLDVQLDGLSSNSGFNNSRFALQFVIASNIDPFGSSCDVTWQTTTTLDDEHTPGIFKTEEVIIPGKNDSIKSYLQWRPIVYTTQKRDLTESTGVYIGAPKDILEPAKTLNYSLLYALYGEDLDMMLVKTFNVSLGSAGDGFYKKTNFQAWTFTYGLGKPIRNIFSPVVILVMTVMAVSLILIFVIAGIFCIVKKWRGVQNIVVVQPVEPAYSRLQ